MSKKSSKNEQDSVKQIRHTLKTLTEKIFPLKEYTMNWFKLQVSTNINVGLL